MPVAGAGRQKQGSEGRRDPGTCTSVCVCVHLAAWAGGATQGWHGTGFLPPRPPLLWGGQTGGGGGEAGRPCACFCAVDGGLKGTVANELLLLFSPRGRASPFASETQDLVRGVSFALQPGDERGEPSSPARALFLYLMTKEICNKFLKLQQPAASSRLLPPPAPPPPSALPALPRAECPVPPGSLPVLSAAIRSQLLRPGCCKTAASSPSLLTRKLC